MIFTHVMAFASALNSSFIAISRRNQLELDLPLQDIRNDICSFVSWAAKQKVDLTERSKNILNSLQKKYPEQVMICTKNINAFQAPLPICVENSTKEQCVTHNQSAFDIPEIVNEFKKDPVKEQLPDQKNEIVVMTSNSDNEHKLKAKKRKYEKDKRVFTNNYANESKVMVTTNFQTEGKGKITNNYVNESKGKEAKAYEGENKEKFTNNYAREEKRRRTGNFIREEKKYESNTSIVPVVNSTAEELFEERENCALNYECTDEEENNEVELDNAINCMEVDCYNEASNRDQIAVDYNYINQPLPLNADCINIELCYRLPQPVHTQKRYLKASDFVKNKQEHRTAHVALPPPFNYFKSNKTQQLNTRNLIITPIPAINPTTLKPIAFKPHSIVSFTKKHNINKIDSKATPYPSVSTVVKTIIQHPPPIHITNTTTSIVTERQAPIYLTNIMTRVVTERQPPIYLTNIMTKVVTERQPPIYLTNTTTSVVTERHPPIYITNTTTKVVTERQLPLLVTSTITNVVTMYPPPVQVMNIVKSTVTKLQPPVIITLTVLKTILQQAPPVSLTNTVSRTIIHKVPPIRITQSLIKTVMQDVPYKVPTPPITETVISSVIHTLTKNMYIPRVVKSTVFVTQYVLAPSRITTNATQDNVLQVIKNRSNVLSSTQHTTSCTDATCLPIVKLKTETAIVPAAPDHTFTVTTTVKSVVAITKSSTTTITVAPAVNIIATALDEKAEPRSINRIAIPLSSNANHIMHSTLAADKIKLKLSQDNILCLSIDSPYCSDVRQQTAAQQPFNIAISTKQNLIDIPPTVKMARPIVVIPRHKRLHKKEVSSSSSSSVEQEMIKKHRSHKQVMPLDEVQGIQEAPRQVKTNRVTVYKKSGLGDRTIKVELDDVKRERDLEKMIAIKLKQQAQTSAPDKYYKEVQPSAPEIKEYETAKNDDILMNEIKDRELNNLIIRFREKADAFLKAIPDKSISTENTKTPANTFVVVKSKQEPSTITITANSTVTVKNETASAAATRYSLDNILPDLGKQLEENNKQNRLFMERVLEKLEGQNKTVVEQCQYENGQKKCVSFPTLAPANTQTTSSSISSLVSNKNATSISQSASVSCEAGVCSTINTSTPLIKPNVTTAKDVRMAKEILNKQISSSSTPTSTAAITPNKQNMPDSLKQIMNLLSNNEDKSFLFDWFKRSEPKTIVKKPIAPKQNNKIQFIEGKQLKDQLIKELLIFINKSNRNEEDILRILRLIKTVKNENSTSNSVLSTNYPIKTDFTPKNTDRSVNNNVLNEKPNSSNTTNGTQKNNSSSWPMSNTNGNDNAPSSTKQITSTFWITTTVSSSTFLYPPFNTTTSAEASPRVKKVSHTKNDTEELTTYPKDKSLNRRTSSVPPGYYHSKQLRTINGSNMKQRNDKKYYRLKPKATTPISVIKRQRRPKSVFIQPEKASVPYESDDELEESLQNIEASQSDTPSDFVDMPISEDNDKARVKERTVTEILEKTVTKTLPRPKVITETMTLQLAATPDKTENLNSAVPIVEHKQTSTEATKNDPVVSTLPPDEGLAKSQEQPIKQASLDQSILIDGKKTINEEMPKEPSKISNDDVLIVQPPNLQLKTEDEASALQMTSNIETAFQIMNNNIVKDENTPPEHEKTLVTIDEIKDNTEAKKVDVVTESAVPNVALTIDFPDNVKTISTSDAKIMEVIDNNQHQSNIK